MQIKCYKNIKHTFCGEYIFAISLRALGIGIATGYGLDEKGIGVRVPVGLRIFSSPRRPDRVWGPHPVSYRMGTGGSFTGGKAAGE
jgi:hypothetical protein